VAVEDSKIEVLSPASGSFSSCENWYRFTTADNYWFKWRFCALSGLLGKGYQWGRVLDIGCGSGIVGLQIKKLYGCAVEGCDLNLSALETASAGMEKVYYYNIHDRVPKFEKSFSTILLLDVLEHVEDPEHFLESAAFHLKDGGRLIINVPAIKSLYCRYDRLAGHIKRYDLACLGRELDSAGFRIDGYRYWGFLLIPLAFLRKLIVGFLREEKVIEAGFQPSPGFMDKILQALRVIECGMLKRPPAGTSLMVVARKKL